MKYEIVELEQKVVVGKSIITSNSDPKMGEEIGKLWQQLYNPETGYYAEIKNKVGTSVIGLYSVYKDGKYSVTAGTLVSEPANSDLVTKTIVKGKYAKFQLHGNMVSTVAKFGQLS